MDNSDEVKVGASEPELPMFDNASPRECTAPG